MEPNVKLGLCSVAGNDVKTLKGEMLSRGKKDGWMLSDSSVLGEAK